jgi:hypothetical protein
MDWIHLAQDGDQSWVMGLREHGDNPLVSVEGV